MKENYWLVWNPKDKPPSYQHRSKEAAIAEAERLAVKHQGERFIVLEAIGEAKTVKPAVFEHYEYIPF